MAAAESARPEIRELELRRDVAHKRADVALEVLRLSVHTGYRVEGDEWKDAGDQDAQPTIDPDLVRAATARLKAFVGLD